MCGTEFSPDVKRKSGTNVTLLLTSYVIVGVLTLHVM